MNNNFINIYYLSDIQYAELSKAWGGQTFSLNSYPNPQIYDIVNGNNVPIDNLNFVTEFETYNSYFLGIL